MGKYEQLSKDIIKNVGGKENINGLTHCITRLRFQLKDESKANDDAIKNMDGVVTLMKSAGQYQVVIGNHVAEAYDEVCKQAGISGGESADAEEKKLGVGATIIDFISGVMMPTIHVLSACGMIKGLLALATFLRWIDPESGLYALINGMGDSIFYFFPVILGFTSAKKLKIDPILGGVIGAALMYPTLQGVDLNILGMDINVSYTSTVLPILLSTILASFIYKWLMKVLPDVIKSFFVPMLTIAVVLPLAFLFIGPAANFISEWVANAITGVYSFSPIIAGFVLGAAWQLLVILGVHMGLVAVAIVQLSTGQPTPILALMFGTTFAQTAAVLAIWIKSKDKNLKGIALPAWISGIFGVTEPAIYGVTLPKIKYFVLTCIFAGLSGAYLAFSGVLCFEMAGLGIFAIPGFFTETMPLTTTMMHVLISIAIAMIPTFIITFMTYKDDEVPEKEAGLDKKALAGTKEKVVSPIKGNVLPLKEAKDETFASEALGKGIVIIPTEGKVYAPVDGTITTLFPTLHAIGITGDSGLEILIHVGMDTVQLEGEGFKAYVAQGDKVKKGQHLLDFDINLIKDKGYSVETPIIITNSKDLLDIVETKSKKVTTKDDLLTALF